MTNIRTPYEVPGAAKYYFDLAGELRQEHSTLLTALEAIIGLLPGELPEAKRIAAEAIQKVCGK
jgi:hypothetical protein